MLWYLDAYVVVFRCLCCGIWMSMLWYLDAYVVVFRCLCCGIWMSMLWYLDVYLLYFYDLVAFGYICADGTQMSMYRRYVTICRT